MKQLFTLFLLISFYSVKAQLNQTNYVVNTANSGTPGSRNTLVGVGVGNENVLGADNSFFGYHAGLKAGPGDNNTLIGSNTGIANKFGYSNTFIGSYSGPTNEVGSNNTFVGQSTGYQNDGSFNTFVGAGVGYNNTIGSYNIFLGYNAAYSNSIGSNNIIIGPNAGSTITDGTDNVIIGYNSQAEDGLHNATAIGSGSRVAINNALILGNNANVGIGTSSPTSSLHVNSTKANESGIRLEQLTASSPTTRLADQFLTVNEQGDVVKARYQLRINNPSEWSDKVFAPGYQLRTLSAVSSYISQHGHLPGVPSAEQVTKEGVDLVKMNATLVEKVEELTLYGIQQEKTIQTLQAEVKELKQMKAEIDELKRFIKK